MVILSKIYTKTGDDGTTSLGDGSRTSKIDQRVRAYGSVDELNSILGLALSSDLATRLREMLTIVQNDLFDLGSDLCTPIRTEKDTRANSFSDTRTAELESFIDELQTNLEPLKSFVLPGGTRAASWLHMARTVCRRAELEVLDLSTQQAVNSATTIYLNRLSDLFFVMARWANREHGEVLWVPGKNVK